MGYRAQRRRQPYVRSILSLIGHLACTAIVCMAIFGFSWCLSVGLTWLHSIHNFSHDIFRLVRQAELILVWVDIAVCAIVLLAGIVGYIRDVLENL